MILVFFRGPKSQRKKCYILSTLVRYGVVEMQKNVALGPDRREIFDSTIDKNYTR